MPIPLEDINYLVLQGAHDMDVVHYMGAKQYERVKFTGQDFYFKTGLYIEGANHGQFNTAWGRKDITEPLSFFFNLGRLMPGDEQRQISAVYLTAFLETTLHDQQGYLPLFRAASAGSQWLPEGIYLNQYEDSETLLINNYEEDIDPSTTSLTGGSVQGHELTVWHESIMPARYGSSENRVVYLGWRSEAGRASYDISLPSDLAVDQKSVLVFSMSGTNEDPCQDEDCQVARSAAYQPPESFDLTVEVSDWEGNTARLSLNSRSVLLPPMETRLAKAPFPMTLPVSEIVLQHYEFPITAFMNENSAFNPRELSMVRLVFDRTQEGVIVLDNTGLRQE
jgi:hypothetical protein